MGSWIRNRIRSSDLGIQDITISDQSGTKEVFFHHHGLDTPIPLRFESSGTKCLFHLLPQVGLALQQRCSCCPRRDRWRSSCGYRRTKFLAGFVLRRPILQTHSFLSLPTMSACSTIWKRKRFLSSRRTAMARLMRAWSTRCARSPPRYASLSPNTGRGCSVVFQRLVKNRCVATRFSLRRVIFHRG